MKTVLILTLTLAYAFQLLASDTTIVFRGLPYAQIFNTANEEKKLVFLYFHFNGCGACVTMEKTTFKDPKVIDFMNGRFVNLNINTREGEGIEINNIFNVTMHPTFMILDEKENILHKWVGVFTPEEFIMQAQNALNGTSRYADFVKRYKDGNRDPEFLYQYTYLLRDVYELPVSIIQEYISTQSLKALYEEKNIRFMYEFALHEHEPGLPFNSRAYNFMLSHRDLFAQYFDKDQVNARLIFIAHRAAYLAIQNDDDTLYYQALSVVKQFPTGKFYEFHEMDGRMTAVIMGKNLPLSLQLAYERKKGDMKAYRITSEKYIEKIWDDSDALNELAWSAYEKETDIDLLQTAVHCVKRSIQLHSEYANNDTYAALLYKTGEYHKAFRQAEKSIAMAEKEEEDFTETSALLEEIKEHLEKK